MVKAKIISVSQQGGEIRMHYSYQDRPLDLPVERAVSLPLSAFAVQGGSIADELGPLTAAARQQYAAEHPVKIKLPPLPENSEFTIAE